MAAEMATGMKDRARNSNSSSSMATSTPARCKGRSHAAGGPGGQQHPALVRGELGDLSEDRAEGGAGLDNGTLGTERAAGANGERGGQRLEDRDAGAYAALPHQDGFHSLGDSVTFQRWLPEIDHEADNQPADRRNQDDPDA